MIIYPAEKSIEDKIIARVKTSIALPYKIKELHQSLVEKTIARLKASEDEEVKKALATEHPDLMYGSAILVSTNVNRNDDAFLPQYTWEARATPVNTPFNDEHEETNIIGHIIGVRLLDEDHKLLWQHDLGEALQPFGTKAYPTGNEQNDEVPDYFDIEADFVVYKDIYPDKAKEIAEGAANGTRFVSMEAKLNDFDYGMLDPTNQSLDVIKRNESTAFLTKYLRAYEGSGEYQGRKLLRVLKNFRFTGMGNVSDPANLKSVYTKINKTDGINSYTKAFYIIKGSTMKIENLEQAEKLVADLNKEVQDLKAKLSVKETEDTKAQITKLTSDLDSEKAKADIASKKVEELQKSINDLTTSLDSTKAELKTKTEELDKLHAEARLAERINKLRAFIEVTDEDKQKYASMTDDAFATVLEFAQKFAAKKEDDKKKKEEEEKEEKEKAAKKKEDKEEEEEMDEEKEKKSKADAKDGDPTEEEKKKKKEEEEKKKKEKETKAALDGATPTENGDLNVVAGSVDNDTLESVAQKLVASLRKNRERKVEIKKNK